jgi:hypothetical protein
MELDKIVYKQSSLRIFYNYTIKFPTEEQYIQRDFLTWLINLWNKYYVIEFPSGINIM